MNIPIWLAISIVLIAFAVSGWIYALCGDLPLLKYGIWNREVDIDFRFSSISSAKDAYNRLNKYFLDNRDKFILKKLKLVGFWKDHLVVKYKLIDKQDEEINFYKIIGDVLNNG